MRGVYLEFSKFLFLLWNFRLVRCPSSVSERPVFRPKPESCIVMTCTRAFYCGFTLHYASRLSLAASVCFWLISCCFFLKEALCMRCDYACKHVECCWLHVITKLLSQPELKTHFCKWFVYFSAINIEVIWSKTSVEKYWIPLKFPAAHLAGQGQGMCVNL